KNLSKKTKKLALLKAISERLKAGDVIVVDALQLDTPKTKGLLEFLTKLKLDRSVVVVAPEFDQNVKLASRNVQRVKLVTSADLNTYQALRGDKLLFTRDGFSRLDERLK